MNEQWYNTLIEELQDIITETSFTSRWALVEGYHTVGKRILEENNNFERSQIYGKNITQQIALSLSKSKRTLEYAVQFSKMFPDLNLLPEGKDIHWRHVINKYLTDGKEKAKKLSPTEQIKQIKEMLEHERLDAFSEGLEDRVEFIRYLQDRIEKITGEHNV